MSGQLFISLLNPGIGLLLAFAFFLLWLDRRDQHYVAVAAASYLISALAFLVQDVFPGLPHGLERIPSNLLFLLSACTLTAAMLGRYGIPAPKLLMAAVVAIGMGLHIWFLLVQPSLAARIYVVNLAVSVIVLHMAVRLYRIPKRQLIDRLLFWTAVLSGINYLVRPILILWMVEAGHGGATFQQSVYWTTVQFSQAMLSIMIALNLMVAVAIDLIRELRREADTDKLSGLLNRRGFETQAQALLRRYGEAGRPVSLLIADLDHFKAVNDGHGHAVGDAVIALFGDHVRSALQGEMVAGRIGGEEFAILMPDVDLGTARSIAESLRTGLGARSAGRLPAGLVPTTSIGLCFARPGASLEQALREADEALYQAKRLGRDRVQVFVSRAGIEGGLAGTAGQERCQWG